MSVQSRTKPPLVVVAVVALDHRAVPPVVHIEAGAVAAVVFHAEDLVAPDHGLLARFRKAQMPALLHRAFRVEQGRLPGLPWLTTLPSIRAPSVPLVTIPSPAPDRSGCP